MRVEYEREFVKNLDNAPARIQKAFYERLVLFAKEPFHPLLRNHALQGRYQGRRSINITGDWRAVFSEYENYDLISFETIGTHSQLYK